MKWKAVLLTLCFPVNGVVYRRLVFTTVCGSGISRYFTTNYDILPLASTNILQLHLWSPVHKMPFISTCAWHDLNIFMHNLHDVTVHIPELTFRCCGVCVCVCHSNTYMLSVFLNHWFKKLIWRIEPSYAFMHNIQDCLRKLEYCDEVLYFL